MSIGPNIILGPKIVQVEIAHEAAHNAMATLDFMAFVEAYPGLNEWIAETAAALPDDVRRRHRLVSEGLMGVIRTNLNRSWPSFPAFIDYLAARNPVTLRDDVFRKLAALGEKRKGEIPNARELLADQDAYITYVTEILDAEYWELDPVIHAEAHDLLQDPAAMLELVVEHLRMMWSTYLAPELTQHEPMIKQSVGAFQQLEIHGLSLTEAIMTVTQRDLRQIMDQEYYQRINRVVFVPSPHVGPYVAMYLNDGQDVLWMVFGARLPASHRPTQPDAAELTRSELLVRLNALADDIRLQIIEALTKYEELYAQEIIDLLALSQSSASRHLRQLSATGFVTERRKEGAKRYKLNTARFEATITALQQFIGQTTVHRNQGPGWRAG